MRVNHRLHTVPWRIAVEWAPSATRRGGCDSPQDPRHADANDEGYVTDDEPVPDTAPVLVKATRCPSTPMIALWPGATSADTELEIPLHAVRARKTPSRMSLDNGGNNILCKAEVVMGVLSVRFIRVLSAH